MQTADFDYDLPPERIAQTAAEPRDSARLLVLDRAAGTIQHRTFRAIGQFLRPGDLLVANDTRVLRARLRGTRVESGGAVEALLLRDLGGGRWQALVRPGRRLQAGRRVRFGAGADAVEAEVEAVIEQGARILRFPAGFDPERIGETPLPPYIGASLSGPERYQTVYAREPGSAAAPTAGLHFTTELLESLQSAGIDVARLTLHIGPGTFRPVSVDDPRTHPMHEENFRLTAETAAQIAAARARGGRVVAVGTTVVRVLEHLAGQADGGPISAAEGSTRLLILPDYRFAAVDGLITNFHLPRSTLLMLVSAFAGREFVLRAYREAVAEGYRFYSFGDAMLLI